ncbi:MAG: hypothetical protein IPF46_16085 [Saprospiraceae bacterium]|nr:hypothetical protein [Candidatus Vicinibacter affinis]
MRKYRLFAIKLDLRASLFHLFPRSVLSAADRQCGETTSPAALGWCEGQIANCDDYLESANSKGFIVLKDGKIISG